MKREIVCPSCSNACSYEKAQGFKKIYGELRVNVVCDNCGTTLNSGELAFALSYYDNNAGIRYFQWEHDFLIVGKEPKTFLEELREIV